MGRATAYIQLTFGRTTARASTSQRKRAFMATTTERSRTVPREKAGNPVWRKAPRALLGYPSLFAALALGAFLVVVSTTAYPLFLSASGGALVRSAIDDPTVTRYGAGI